MGISGLDKANLMLDDFEIDEVVLTPKRHVADGDGQGLPRDPWLKLSNTVYTFTNMSLSPLFSWSAHNNLTSYSFVSTQRSRQQHTHCLGKYPINWDAKHVG